MGTGPLPWRAIRAWAHEHDIRRPDDFDDLLAVVKHLDGLWLTDAVAKLKKPLPKPQR